MDYNKLGYHGKYQQQGETIGFIHQQVKDPRATCWLGASTVGHIFFSLSGVCSSDSDPDDPSSQLYRPQKQTGKMVHCLGRVV